MHEGNSADNECKSAHWSDKVQALAKILHYISGIRDSVEAGIQQTVT